MSAHEFVDVDELIERLKDRLSSSVNGFVSMQDVAKALGIKTKILFNAKYRKSIARILEPLVRYCIKEEINVSELLIKQTKPKEQ